MLSAKRFTFPHLTTRPHMELSCFETKPKIQDAMGNTNFIWNDLKLTFLCIKASVVYVDNRFILRNTNGPWLFVSSEFLLNSNAYFPFSAAANLPSFHELCSIDRWKRGTLEAINGDKLQCKFSVQVGFVWKFPPTRNKSPPWGRTFWTSLPFITEGPTQWTKSYRPNNAISYSRLLDQNSC